MESKALARSRKSNAHDARVVRFLSANVFSAGVRRVASLPGTEPHCAGPIKSCTCWKTGPAIDTQYHFER
eukprot:1138479-Pyramimonas_sp.AAC.1